MQIMISTMNIEVLFSYLYCLIFLYFFPAFLPYLVCKTKNRKHENTLVEYIIKDLIVTVR